MHQPGHPHAVDRRLRKDNPPQRPTTHCDFADKRGIRRVIKHACGRDPVGALPKLDGFAPEAGPQLGPTERLSSEPAAEPAAELAVTLAPEQEQG